ncbi:MAG TPA: DUF3090 domain-containing protein [Anaerolineales bacterium]|jgi:uncharacterized repeat protein (TIGR03847 family)|nr:DUF3090 domain-containing protein [Anaerolineales bacterium]
MDDFENNEIELKPVSHITADAIGPPGKRVFYLQGTKGTQVVTLIIEKFQLQTLTIGIDQFLAEILQRMPLNPEYGKGYQEERMRIMPPVEPMFRVAEFGLSFDGENDLVGVIAREVPSPPEGSSELEQGRVVKFWCTRAQVRALVDWGMEVASRGRPPCEQCGEPMDPEGHFCARKNGHKE